MLDRIAFIVYYANSVHYMNDVRCMKKTPRQRRHARTRQHIIDIAFAMIQQHGLEQFSLREVARRADFSPAGLYKYFNDKDDLIVAVSQESRARILSVLQAVPSDTPAPTYVLELCLAFLRYARREPTYIQLLSRDNPSAVEYFEDYQPEDFKGDEITRLFHDALQRGIDDGTFHADDDFGALEMFYGLWTMAIGMIFAQLNVFDSRTFDFETVDRLAVQAFLRGLSHPSA